jgi:hypothetical protein
MRTVIEIDPRTIDILDQAEREHYRIMACTLCGGPEVHAKHKAAAKRVRCGHYRTLEQITPLVTRQRCRRCQETFWAVLKTTTCANCRGKWTQAQNRPPARPHRPTLKNDGVLLRILRAFRTATTCDRADKEPMTGRVGISVFDDVASRSGSTRGATGSRLSRRRSTTALDWREADVPN